ncbi:MULTISPECIES: copper homeostasis periplasmic binding protein CopC [Herbaspirillum]|jgi:methionine-rich copper-binding protein CopC|uniref:Copper homeostasis periplasmic binding protein CopC n=2 Tax=Herbaspirillum huttiense TaxID=863372 RepID=A0AAJ2HGT4_9BURK|nr:MULTISPECIES: copper homeostasis periplasmic binding protein CopC [Herbaspirillum]MCI1014221.1 copper homeostasis periplasmic binding protein CopC [Herbaspirillum sp. C7C2]MDR9839740.1 copper homeostasis periplasmic binding protein CopC [Herbaspirillum huttiense]MEE1639661.1 copper homeostasis periplasmic binding protein CopC [Herbaspirillum huttiense NC40101]
MSYQSFIAKSVVTIAAAAFATAAFAHPKLLGSNPEDNSTVSAPEKIELRFSENLSKQFSGANVMMTSMPGMSHGSPMKVAAKVSGADDPKIMIITPSQPLMPGVYSIEWRAVSSDTHPITGKVTFTVK